MRIANIACMAAVALGACGTGERGGGFILAGMSEPDTTHCTALNAPSAFLSRGVLDVFVAGRRGAGYEAAMLLQNRLFFNESRQAAQPNTGDIQVQGAVVQLFRSAATGATCHTAPAIDVGGCFGAGGQFTAAQGTVPATRDAGMFVELVPPCVVRALREDAEGGCATRFGETLFAEVRVQGTTLGNWDVETPPVCFPIDVCYGCTIEVAVDDIKPVGPPTDPMDETTRTAPFACCGAAPDDLCLPGQDRVAPCTALGAGLRLDTLGTCAPGFLDEQAQLDACFDQID